MPNVNPNAGKVCYRESFASANIGTGIAGVDGGTAAATGIVWIQAMDTGDTPFARTWSAARGPHFAGSGSAVDNHLMELCADNAMFYGTTGMNAVEVMLQFDTTSSPLAFNFGLNDDSTGSATLPVELSTTSFASTAATFLGFVYDADATNDELHCFWTDDTNDTTEAIANLRMQGASLEANKWMYLRVETQDRGSGNGLRATFHAEIGEKSFEKVFNTTVDNDVALYWYLGIEARSALAWGHFVTAPAWEIALADDNT